MIEKAINRLEFLCDSIPQLLIEIDEQAFSIKPSPNKWSKKEIIGHLIDSATNNHQRFVRGQFEDSPTISYEQDKWIECSYYQQMPKQKLIDFWTIYNRHLAGIMRLIPAENLLKTCKLKDGTVQDLDFLINDYVDHQEHHLRQVINY